MILGLMGCSPVALHVDVPSGPTRDGVLVVETDARWVEVHRGDDVFPVDQGRFQLATLGSGTHALTVVAGGLPQRQRAQPLTVQVDVDPPQVSIAERSLTVQQGHTLAVVLTTDETATLTLQVGDRERPLYLLGERRWRALVGVPIRQEPGPLPLVVTATDALGNTGTHTREVTVEAVDWPITGKLPLSKKKATVAEPAIEQMRSERDPIYAEQRSEAVWDGPMRIPTTGTHTSVFGSFREYPDGRRSHHDAEDIARRRGTPVVAAAAGEVRLARMQAVHGNAVLLAHGQGVVSLYSHLDELDVKEGQQVAAGEQLGKMGSTGRSTGPHLHWGVVVDQVPVDPMEWSETGFESADFVRFVPLTTAP